MVVDTSALVAILEGEPEGEAFARLLEEASTRLLSAVSLLETSIVVGSRKGTAGTAALHSLLRDAELEVVPFDRQQADEAARAYLRFGKGHHAAGLNFGDCASYALAHVRDDTLLFKGNDFGQTDIAPAAEAHG